MGDQRFAPRLERELYQRVNRSAFGAAQSQADQILFGLANETAVLELSATAA
jgi:hypothetical protein